MSWWVELSTSWRSGTHRSQLVAAGGLTAGVASSFAVSVSRYELFPLAGYFLWLMLGMLLLRFWPLVALTGAISVAGVVACLSQEAATDRRVAGIVILALAVALVLYVASRQRSGLPTPLSEALLSDLRDRLTAQGRVPDLPAGWHAQSAMVAAYGVGYAGDFMVADLDEDRQQLELVLVDAAHREQAQAILGKVATAGVQVEPNGRTLTAGVDGGTAPLMQVLAELEQGSIGVLDVGLRRPTLDDVFLTLTGRGTQPDDKTETADQEAS